jgi:hypothetical protein
MAIKYKDIKKKLETDPLTESELVLIRQAEEHVDSEIVKQFGESCSYGEVRINLGTAQFEWSQVTKTSLANLKQPRKHLMFRELEKRYKEAGWVTKIHIDTDGGMNSCDYWILKGKDK